MLFKNNNLDNFEVSMVTEIEVSEALVKIPQITTKLEELFRNAQPSKEDRDKILIFSLELQRLTHVVATWALRS